MQLKFPSVKEKLNYVSYFHVCQSDVPSIKLSLLFNCIFLVKIILQNMKCEKFCSELQLRQCFVLLVCFLLKAAAGD